MRRKQSQFWIGLIIALSIVAISFCGGYFVIDRVLIPKYFDKYGINNLSELVGVVKTIYTTPNEEEFIINPFTKVDSSSATKKLSNAGFPTLKSGAIDYTLIASGGYILEPTEKFVDNFILLTDKEVAAIANDILNSGLLEDTIPELSYFNTLNISIKQVIFSPSEEMSKEYQPTNTDENSQEKNIVTTSNVADIVLTIKLDVANSKKLISETLNIPQFLVDWIVPNTIYATSSIRTEIDLENNKKTYSNANLSINGKTAKQSEVLLNMLISFMFPNQVLTIDELANQIGSLAIDGMDLLGEITFATISTNQTNLSGIKLII